MTAQLSESFLIFQIERIFFKTHCTFHAAHLAIWPTIDLSSLGISIANVEFALALVFNSIRNLKFIVLGWIFGQIYISNWPASAYLNSGSGLFFIH